MTESVGGARNTQTNNMTNRSQRIQNSLAFSSGLEPVRGEPRQTTFTPLHINEELQTRIALLQRLAAPRHSLPPRIARYRLLRWRPVQRAVLRIWNYFTLPGRTQSQATAECIELIYAELKRTTQYVDR